MSSDKENEDSFWKSIIEKVKKEGKYKSEKSIERPKEITPKEDIQKSESIEKSIDIEKPIGKSIEKIKKEEFKEITPREEPIDEPNKFTTIMITKKLKERLAEEKNSKESYGKFIERLLENK